MGWRHEYWLVECAESAWRMVNRLCVEGCLAWQAWVCSSFPSFSPIQIVSSKAALHQEAVVLASSVLEIFSVVTCTVWFNPVSCFAYPQCTMLTSSICCKLCSVCVLLQQSHSAHLGSGSRKMSMVNSARVHNFDWFQWLIRIAVSSIRTQVCYEGLGLWPSTWSCSGWVSAPSSHLCSWSSGIYLGEDWHLWVSILEKVRRWISLSIALVTFVLELMTYFNFLCF